MYVTCYVLRLGWHPEVDSERLLLDSGDHVGVHDLVSEGLTLGIDKWQQEPNEANEVEDVEKLAPDSGAASQQFTLLVDQPGPMDCLARCLSAYPFEMAEIAPVRVTQQAEEVVRAVGEY